MTDFLDFIGPWWGMLLIFVIGSIVIGWMKAGINKRNRKEDK